MKFDDFSKYLHAIDLLGIFSLKDTGDIFFVIKTLIYARLVRISKIHISAYSYCLFVFLTPSLFVNFFAPMDSLFLLLSVNVYTYSVHEVYCFRAAVFYSIIIVFALNAFCP